MSAPRPSTGDSATSISRFLVFWLWSLIFDRWPLFYININFSIQKRRILGMFYFWDEAELLFLFDIESTMYQSWNTFEIFAGEHARTSTRATVFMGYRNTSFNRNNFILWSLISPAPPSVDSRDECSSRRSRPRDEVIGEFISGLIDQRSTISSDWVRNRTLKTPSFEVLPISCVGMKWVASWIVKYLMNRYYVWSISEYNKN